MSKKSGLKPAALALALAALAFLGYLTLKPNPTPKSPALEVERGAEHPGSQPVVRIGEAAPLTPPNNIEIPSESLARETAMSAGNPVAPSIEPATSPALQGEAGQPQHAATPDKPTPSESEGNGSDGQLKILNPQEGGDPANPPAGHIDEGAIMEVKQRLDMLQALIERLERSERVLGARLNGLEIANAKASANTASGGMGGTEDGFPVTTSNKTNRKPPKPQSVVLRQRRTESSPSPLPFFVESIDTWNGQKTVVIRQGGKLIDVRPGESRAGWRVESADGNTVTLIDPRGAARTVTAGEEGRP